MSQILQYAKLTEEATWLWAMSTSKSTMFSAKIISWKSTSISQVTNFQKSTGICLQYHLAKNYHHTLCLQPAFAMVAMVKPLSLEEKMEKFWSETSMIMTQWRDQFRSKHILSFLEEFLQLESIDQALTSTQLAAMALSVSTLLEEDNHTQVSRFLSKTRMQQKRHRNSQLFNLYRLISSKASVSWW